MDNLKKYKVYIPAHEPVVIYARYFKQTDKELIFYNYDVHQIKNVAVFYTNVIAGFVIIDED